MTSKQIGWILVLLVSVQAVAAIGIQPAKTTIIAEETLSAAGEFWVVNNEHRDFNVKVYPTGEMAKYITVKTATLAFSKEDDAKAVEFDIRLPENVPPGESAAYVVIEEVLGNSEPDVIASRLLLKHKVVIQGEYPDKYIEVKINFHEGTDKVRMVSEIENKGKLDISKVKTEFRVNDKDEKEHILDTEETSLSRAKTKLLSAEIEKNKFNAGEYTVSSVTRYDDLEVELVNELRIGEPKVEVTYFDKFFTAYKIDPYTMDLGNKWNKNITNVYVDVAIKKDEQKIDEFRTKSVDIEGEATKRINDYLDARDKAPGSYMFEMVVNFLSNRRMHAQTFQSELLPEEAGTGSVLLTAIVGGLALAIGIGGIAFYRKSKKMKGGGTP